MLTMAEESLLDEQWNARDTLELQLSEVEMLSSMYPGSGEFELDDPACVEEIKCYVEDDSASEELISRIGFTMKLDQEDDETPLEMVCHFPHEYPSVYPEVFLRTSLPKSDHRRFCDDLYNFIQKQELGNLMICSVIEWLKDNSSDYRTVDTNHQPNTVTKARETTFSRMWIYSHHIYSKIKRKDILEFAPELHLSGFSMPGKPGIICIEGYNSDVEEFWYRIRRMQWKAITMKEKEDYEMADNDVNHFRKFKGFEEKHFDPRPGKGRGAHMDLGELYKFLDDHGCAKMFNIYFGVDGRTKDD